MKKLTLIITVSLLCGIASNINAQQWIKIDATFYSEMLDEVKYIDIYLPADYYVNPEQQYATIYYLHGASGDQNEGNTDALWYYNLHNEDTTISSPPAIFVCPDGSSEPYLGSCWMNSELYGSFEDYFIQDVIGFIESNFRALPDKNFRSLVGWSMGGFGSARFSIKYHEMFRACVPCIGFPAMPDTLLNAWKELYYIDNGSYVPTISNAANTQLLLTICGGLSPNMSNPPCYVDFPFDTLGNWVDTVLNRWYENDLSRKVKNLPDEHDLSWFLICGTQDYMVTYPAYQVFMDSLDTYNIGYDYNFFEGGHEFDPESWMMAIHWLDSIINHSYQTIGIPVYGQTFRQFAVYPNPASDLLTISSTVLTHIAQLSIFNVSGEKLVERQLTDTEMQLDISALPRGVYFVRVWNENSIETVKMIKQ